MSELKSNNKRTKGMTMKAREEADPASLEKNQQSELSDPMGY